MQLEERIHLVGSGAFGFDLTDPYDCHIYLVDGGSELALVDVGAGMGTVEVIANVRRAGFDPAGIRHVLCTHAHGDHAGGAARMRALLPNASFSASPYAAERSTTAASKSWSRRCAGSAASLSTPSSRATCRSRFGAGSATSNPPTRRSIAC